MGVAGRSVRVPEQQAFQRIERVIRLGKVGEQRGVVGRGGLAVPAGAKRVKNLAKAFPAVDQPQDFCAVFAGVDHQRHARMLVREHEGLALVAAKDLRRDLAGQRLVVEKRNVGRIAIRRDGTRRRA